MDSVMQIGARQVETLRAPHMAKATTLVARGAALLDKKRPGWWRTLRLREFDMSSGCYCVLGLMFTKESDAHLTDNGFDIGLRQFKLTHPAAYGFNDGGTNDTPNYDELQFAWWQLIKQRQTETRARARKRAARVAHHVTEQP